MVFRKILTIFMFILFIFSGLNIVDALGGEAPAVNCYGLPGCENNDVKTPSTSLGNDSPGNTLLFKGIKNLIELLIQYTAVVAVITIMIGAMMFLFSGGDEEKIKKAKKWMIYSGVGVIVSILSFTIISIIDKLKI